MKNKTLNYIDIIEDLEAIKKSLYLDSPDFWIEFTDKISDEIIDEMVLFYSAKYNHYNVLKFVVDNNILDLNAPSRNKNFPSIKSHLMAVAAESDSSDVCKYLTSISVSSNNSTSDTIHNTNNQSKQNVDKSVHFPEFICSSCNKNIFENGYNIIEKIKFVYNPETKICEESSRVSSPDIFCNNCNNHLKEVTLDLLQKISNINNCTKCGENLTVVGIEQKIKMTLDKNNKFIPSQKSYVCPCCQNKLNDSQIDFLNI